MFAHPIVSQVMTRLVPGPFTPRSAWLTIGWVTIVTFVIPYAIARRLGLTLEASPVWPSSGVNLAFLWICGPRIWPGIFLGSLTFHLWLGATPMVSILAAIGNLAESGVGHWLLRRHHWNPHLNRVADVLKFIGWGAVCAPMINATLSSWNGCLAGIHPWTDYWPHWGIIWLADSIGILVITPLILLAVQLPAHLQSIHWQGWRSGLRDPTLHEWLLWLGLVIGISWSAYHTPLANSEISYLLEYLPFPLIGWAALRLGSQSTLFGSFVVSSIAIWGILGEQGPFLAKTEGVVRSAIVLLQWFIGILTSTALLLSAIVHERQHAERSAEKTLQFVIERDRLLSEMVSRIRQSLNLSDILNTTVEEVRQALKADRVFLACIDAKGCGRTIAESLDPKWPSAMDWVTPREVVPMLQTVFANQRIRTVNDIRQVPASPLFAQYYKTHHVLASLTVAIVLEGRGFGILTVNQCDGPRDWQPFEIDLMDKLANQVEIAFQQGQLYEQVQTAAANLERQVNARTAELQARMDELDATNHLKDLLLHAVSHDLKTPTQGMVMLLNRLRDRHPGSAPNEIIPVQRRILDSMIQSGDRQLQLLNSLMNQQTETGFKCKLDRQPVPIDRVIQAAIQGLQSPMAIHQSTCVTHIESEIPPVTIDPSAIQEVFQQLLTNAMQHNPSGVKLTIAVQPVAPRVEWHQPSLHPDQLLYCTVTDDGCGMTPDQCDRAFKLYVRGVNNHHLTGIGLGLYRCQQIIEAHGGAIGLESSPGAGVTVWFTLPVV